MLIIAPILLMLLAALTIVIVNKVKQNFALTFMIAAISAFATWLIMLIFRVYLPSTVSIVLWKPEVLYPYSPFLLLDYQSWSFALAINSICIAALFTDSARTNTESNPISWSGMLSMSALGMLALLAGNPLTLLLAWTFLDIIEFFYLIFTHTDESFKQRAILSLALRFLSLVIFIWATMVGWHKAGEAFDITNIPATASIYYLLAAGLRLGIFSFLNSEFNKQQLTRGLGTVTLFVPVASCLSLIGRLSNIAYIEHHNLILVFKAFIALTALYSALRWTKVQDEVKGQSFWISSFSAFSLFSIINGYQSASRAWGVALLLSGSFLFLFHPKIWRLRFLQFFGVLGIIALPFTPTAAGWEGIIGNEFSFWSLIILLSHVILVFGYIHLILNLKASSANLETWAKIIFPLGLIILIQSGLIIGVIGWPGSFTLGTWWMGAMSITITGTLLLVDQHYKIQIIGEKFIKNSKLAAILLIIKRNTELFFRLNWLKKTMQYLLKMTIGLLTNFSSILEGEGGILWALLVLLMLITLIITI